MSTVWRSSCELPFFSKLSVMDSKADNIMRKRRMMKKEKGRRNTSEMKEIYQAKWISMVRDGSRMPVFGRDVYLETVPVSARIAVCGLGQFALFVGEQEINQEIFEPGWTNYRKTCLYSVYDLTQYLHPGENRIRVMMGNGMYHIETERYHKFEGSFGDPRMVAALELMNADGKKDVILTDEKWRGCYGPVLFTSIFGGEDYDAGICEWKEQTDTEHWKKITVSDGGTAVLKESAHPPVRIMHEILPVSKIKLSEHSTCYDFGRNFAGRVGIRVRGLKGQKVRVIPGELLQEDGTVSQEFTGSPYYNVYTLAGEGLEEWIPRFTYYGQRYVVIETDAELIGVWGAEQFADCPQTGQFRCSNDMYNRIHELILGAVKSNMQSIFTDCPHREKLGWLEELHLIGPGILADFDAEKLFEKVLDDMEDSQTTDGLVPDICPEYTVFDFGFRDSPEWGSSCVLVPWYLYMRYGKREVLEKHFEMGQSYTRYLLSKSKDYILNYGLGDWLDVGHYPMHPANTPIPVTATAILYQDLKVMARISEVLGKTGCMEWYEQQAANCRKAFRETFFYPLSGNYATGSQTANAMALYLGMTEENEREVVMENLKQDIAARDGHFTGGDIGHPYILRALAEGGENAIVAQNLMKTDFPGYGFQVMCHATTLCEDWAGPDPEHPVMSQNHFMLGGAEEWFYRSLGGIRVDASAPERICIQPCFPAEVQWTDCSTLTPAGICHVRWEKEETTVTVRISLERKERVRLRFGGLDEVVELEGTTERIVKF